jgi:type II secretory pathway pseudopilin PulG
VLLAVALLGIGLAAASEVWTAVARSQKLEQLEWVGQQYV